jgi:NAD(P)-dependent dehydrogenase (short-subunit alcohol dehydrogenase family)
MILTSKNIVITGGGGGIGSVVAQKCIAQGANVILIGINEKELKSAPHSMYLVADVASETAIQKAFNTITRTYKTIDVLINAAGVQHPIGTFDKNKLSSWKKNIEINLFGTINTTHTVLLFMKKQKFGKIINFSGGGATGPRQNFSAYACAKTAVVRFTEILAEEIKKYNIDVNAIAPGAVNTNMLQEVLNEKENAGKEYTDAVKRKNSGGTSPEIAANLILFLSSEKSNGITGRLISAPWDSWKDEKFQNKLRTEKNMCTLRRIDEKYFYEKKGSCD